MQRINLECLIRSEWLLQVEWSTDIWINQIYTIRWSVTATAKFFQQFVCICVSGSCILSYHMYVFVLLFFSFFSYAPNVNWCLILFFLHPTIFSPLLTTLTFIRFSPDVPDPIWLADHCVLYLRVSTTGNKLFPS